MSKLLSKKKVVEQEEEVTKPIDFDEIEGHQFDSEELKTASNETLDFMLNLVASKFNVGSEYIMTKFSDGSNSCAITLANKDFEVSVKVHDKFSMGFPNPLDN